MVRLPYVLKIKEGKKERALEALSGLWNEAKALLTAQGIRNFSIWNIGDFLFCYGEYPDEVLPTRAQHAACLCWDEGLSSLIEGFAGQGTLPLMYHDIGIVREDKSLIRHRVFATRLKEGCADEYKRRHDALVAARGDRVTEGPESNFTIWNARGYIFGYCELVKSYDHEMTDEERASTVAWETRQLEIMDWLTDDVDWMTGEKHDRMVRVCGM